VAQANTPGVIARREIGTSDVSEGFRDTENTIILTVTFHSDGYRTYFVRNEFIYRRIIFRRQRIQSLVPIHRNVLFSKRLGTLQLSLLDR